MVFKLVTGLALAGTALIFVACSRGEAALPTQTSLPPVVTGPTPGFAVSDPKPTLTPTATPPPALVTSKAPEQPEPVVVTTPLPMNTVMPVRTPAPQVVMPPPTFPPPPGQSTLLFESQPQDGFSKYPRVSPKVVPVAEASESWEPVQADGEHLPVDTGEGGYADADVVALPGGGYRMYVGDMNTMSILSLLSSDGLIWEFEPGVRVTRGAFPDVLQLSDGRVRMYYEGTRVIESSISNDGGLTFVKEPGIRVDRGWHGDIDPDNVAASTTIQLPDGRFRMYYRAGDEDDQWMNGIKTVILSATSDDGLTFTPEEGVRISPEDWIDPTAPNDISYLDGPDAIITNDGRVKLYFWGVSVCSGVCLAETQDGLTFNKVEQVFSIGSTAFEINAGDPSVLRVDDGTWLMYYGNGSQHDNQGIWMARLTQ